MSLLSWHDLEALYIVLLINKKINKSIIFYKL